MEILLIAAMAANRTIGADNIIPWHIPGEQARFRQTTWGFPLIMGRKTHESIGRVLPGRRNIVVTRDEQFTAPGLTVAHSLDEALAACAQEAKVFVIGGEQIFRQALPLAHSIILSVLDEPWPGDARFPEFSTEEFSLQSAQRIQYPLPYTICVYSRVKPRAPALLS